GGRLAGVARGRHALPSSDRYAAAGHQLFGPQLARLDARRCPGRPEHALARRLKRVDDAGRKGSLGADDREVDFVGRSKVDQAGDVIGWSWNRVRELRDASVSGGSIDGRDLGGLVELPGEGMLASPAAYNENAHAFVPLARRIRRGLPA